MARQLTNLRWTGVASAVVMAAGVILPLRPLAVQAPRTASPGITYHFPAPPIAPAGSLGPGQSQSFNVRVLDNGVIDPGATVYLGYFQGGHVVGDSTAVPPSQCKGVSVLPSDGTAIPCTADAKGVVTLTYQVPSQPPAQGRADWVAEAAPNSSVHAVDHYVYTAVYRFNPSPIATSGSLSPGQSVPVTLTAEDGLDRGIPNDTVYLSVKSPAGSHHGTATVGTTVLTTTPTLFTTNGSGVLQITYTAPSSAPSNGLDVVVVQDLASAPTEKNSDSYSFLASTPVISVGDVTVVEGDATPGIPAEFTVTISPVQPTDTTVQYKTLCGIGDKGCGEDFVQVNGIVTVTIPANTSSTTVLVRQFAYIGGNAGEAYNEGWYVLLANPSAGVLGRSVGEGMLLPDVENTTTALPYLYTGDAAVQPTPDGQVPLYLTVTLGAVERTDVTFSYRTADGTATAGRDYSAASGVATIPAGQTSAVILVDLLPNRPPSSNRTFIVTISGASAGITISGATGTGTVLAG